MSLLQSSTNKRRTALFFGSFNPVHCAHLMLAQYVLLFAEVDDVWLVVSPQNPFKESKDLAPAHHRLRMLQIATGSVPTSESPVDAQEGAQPKIQEGAPRISPCDIELSLPMPSYTVRTIEALEARHPQREFVIVMGADNLPGLPKWRDADKLFRGRQLIVCPRPGEVLNLEPVEQLGAHVQVLNAPLLEVSSTNIRQWVAAGLDVTHFVPAGVARYIAEHGLYRQ